MKLPRVSLPRTCAGLLATVTAVLEELKTDIKDVMKEINETKAELRAAKERGDMSEVKRLTNDVERLGRREESMRDKEKRNEELLLVEERKALQESAPSASGAPPHHHGAVGPIWSVVPRVCPSCRAVPASVPYHLGSRERSDSWTRAFISECTRARPASAGRKHDLWSLLGTRAVDKAVVRRMYEFYSSRIDLLLDIADEEVAREVACDLFEETRNRPAYVTKEHFQTEGYLLNGPLHESPNLHACFKGLEKHVVKRLGSAEAKRVLIFREALGEVAKISAHIIHFTLWENVEAGHTYMLMPLLPTTLEPFPWLLEEDAHTFWLHMSDALTFLHDLGFVHADVKPANVCIRNSAEFVLIDLGSLCRSGCRTSSTPAYVPSDLRLQGVSAELDWWMLGMAMAEKCCGERALAIGGNKSAKTGALLAHLQEHLPGRIWDAYDRARKLSVSR